MTAKERVYNGEWCETPAGENLHQTTSVIPKIFRIPDSGSGLIFSIQTSTFNYPRNKCITEVDIDFNVKAQAC